MKKSLLALAVAAALPAAAFAQTNVQIYGIGDVNLTIANDDASSNGDTQIQMNDGLQSSSRVGIQGSEDLGGGLSATFRFELGLDVDDGDAEGTFFGRQARVGLKGGFGEVRMGRQYTPIFWSVIDYDFAGNGWYNNHYALAGSDGRWDNAVEYRNRFGGLELVGAIAPTESADPNADDFVYGLTGNYNGGSWGVGGGYQSEGDQDIIHVGGKVQLGAFGFGINYGIADRENGSERTDIALSAGLKIGAAGNMVLNVLLKEDDAAADSTEIGLAYGHALSKRTNWYVALGIDDIDGVNGAAGTTPTLLSVGVRHKF